jgi:tRNA threonylcarbamoyladenosine biosynthesis protein TsaB
MITLGVDTSVADGGLGIVDDDQVRAEHTFSREETPSVSLIPTLQSLLEEARLDLAEIEGIAVSLGPGSFTGVRVGLSAVKGLALATAKAVVGVPGLDALAGHLPVTPRLICPLVDARKGEVYAALYRKRTGGEVERLTPYWALSPAALMEKIPRRQTIFLGDGAEVYGEFIKGRMGEHALFAPPQLRFLRGAMVAELGRKRLMKGECDDVSSLVPIYVRQSDAEIKWAGRGVPLRFV